MGPAIDGQGEFHFFQIQDHDPRIAGTNQTEWRMIMAAPKVAYDIHLLNANFHSFLIDTTDRKKPHETLASVFMGYP